MTDKERTQLLDIIKKHFGECVRVDIEVTAQGMVIKANERTKPIDFSMKNINGDWVRSE